MDFLHGISHAVSEALSMDAEDIAAMMEKPPNREMGDYALPCFKLASRLKKAPPLISKELTEKVIPPGFVSRMEAAGGYLNFFIDKSLFAKNTLERVMREGQAYGGSEEGRGKTICIDYSSINIAKPFHIGHLSTTVIGNALYKLYSHLGYRCIGINHLGDWGTQFGKLIVAFKRWGDRERIEAGTVSEMLRLYVKFHDEAEKDPSLEDEARVWFKKIEDGDEEALSIFNFFKELTMRDVQHVYDMLDIRFDSCAGESFYNDKTAAVIEELRAKELLEESDGAFVVNLDEYGLPPCMIVKSDGATLYATRDIAAAIYRKKSYDFDKCLYVVAYQQNLHFKQWFRVVEKMGYSWYKDLEHVAFGMVSMEEGTLSTRKGRVVLLEEVLKSSVGKARSIIEEKSPDLEDKDGAARMVGVGAVVFGALINNRIKDIVFSYDRALNFDGETAPYVQYTHARSCSVMRKSGGGVQGKIDYSLLCDDDAQEVVQNIAAFPATVKEACRRNEPSLIARLIVDLAQSFNRFYYDHRILEEDISLRNARLMLTDCTRHVIALGLGLLGIAAPERM
ncbi:MAG: arginine--tRNA ligase [Bacillota bacterium]|nr:arginine--tRNA ligase [Bacillota bacterium]